MNRKDAGLLTASEAAALLGVSERTLRRWDQARCGPPRSAAGRKPIYRLDTVLHWLKRQERGT
ncbi:helix-turn-helix transcriptional regulator, partial [Paralimibaculum aggregatum]|uniref:helix-turn-helix transcriptional regulator n=1 Tax=Paralimibaculum aggregatum TaxID=3036245 RepID=UPI0025536D6D